MGAVKEVEHPSSWGCSPVLPLGNSAAQSKIRGTENLPFNVQKPSPKGLKVR